MPNVLLMGCSGLVHTCRLHVCNCVVRESAGGRLAFVFGKRSDFHPSEAGLKLAESHQEGRATTPGLVILELVWDVFRFSVWFLVRWLWVGTESYDHIDIKVMSCTLLPEVISPDC